MIQDQWAPGGGAETWGLGAGSPGEPWGDFLEKEKPGGTSEVKRGKTALQKGEPHTQRRDDKLSGHGGRRNGASLAAWGEKEADLLLGTEN